MQVINEDRLFVSKSLEGKIGVEQLQDPAADDLNGLVVELSGSRVYVKTLQETDEIIEIEGSCFSMDLAGIFSDKKPSTLQIQLGEDTILTKNVEGAVWSCKANTFSEDNYDVSIMIIKAHKKDKKNVKK